MAKVRTPSLGLFVSLVVTGPAFAQGFTPEQALARMRVPDGLEVRLVAAEPQIRQPVAIQFDGRGRLWVAQYLQYPNPAGLKAVAVDQYLRTRWDRVPEPPPRGPRGADKITILSDPDADGRFTRAKDFVTGLNLCTGFCAGHGGVFVMQAPYLLFYPDRDGDDTPDGDPEVLLSGFGTEDPHAYANSLQWGPDGWLYGAQGSTVTANVRGVEFQQGIWRYHPLTRRFELFSEGGGNTWGLDFDARGQIIAGTNFGGEAALHQAQGAYHVKGFSKHGPLHNPHAYGYFGHVPYRGFKGGHVTNGGIIYQADALPALYRGQYLAANLLDNVVRWHNLERHGSTFRAAHGGELLESNDTWFRPIDLLTGPDGAVYVADWYDRRANHVDPVDNWDKTNGRVYKIQSAGHKGSKTANIDKLPSADLVGLLGHANNWYSREARRALAERRDESVLPELRRRALSLGGRPALEATWALYVSGGFDAPTAAQLLAHADEDVRAWAVRLIGDDCAASPGLVEKLAALAAAETSAVVRAQLACTAKRLPGRDGLAVTAALLGRDADGDDPYISLLVWWAIEDKAVRERDAVLEMLHAPERWRSRLVRGTILERLARRYFAEGGTGTAAVARLLESAPDHESRTALRRGLSAALAGRRLERTPTELEPLARSLLGESAHDALALAFRLGNEEAFGRVCRAAETGDARAVTLLGQSGRPEAVPILVNALRQGRGDALRGEAMAALSAFNDPAGTREVLAAYNGLSAALKSKAVATLAARPESARMLLERVDQGTIPKEELSLDQVRGALESGGPAVAELVRKHWGRVGPASAGEKAARAHGVKVTLSRNSGDAAKGKALFTKNCASCHTLFNEGNKIGPDLTTADRKNRDWLVSNVVDPSAYVRPEYTSFRVSLDDGRTLTGLVAASSADSVTLLDEKNERRVIPRASVEELVPSAVSLMPEKILDALGEQEVCDLFAYLSLPGPPK